MANNINIEVLGSSVLPAALYGCEIWSFAYAEECMLRIVDNAAIKQYFEHRQEKLEGWKNNIQPNESFVT
jgi:hypothetical protein